MKRMTLLLACTLALAAVPSLFAEEPSGPVAPPLFLPADGACAGSASTALQPLPLDLPDLAGITGIAGSVPASHHLCNKPCSTCAEAELKCGWDCWCRGLCEYSFQCYAPNPCGSSCICTPC